MLILRSSPASPFARKVRIAAAMLGLSERIEVVAADTSDPADSLRRQNPLGKIPALIIEDGEAIFDSRVILEYLDWLAGAGALIPGDSAGSLVSAATTSMRSLRPRIAAAILTLRPKGEAGDDRKTSIGTSVDGA